MATTTVTG